MKQLAVTAEAFWAHSAGAGAPMATLAIQSPTPSDSALTMVPCSLSASTQTEAIVAAAAKVGGEVDALDGLVESLKRGDETTLSIVVDLMFPTSSLVKFAQDFARAHPCVELLLFTDILSSVTSHVRERRSSWGIAIEDADLTDLDHRRIAEVRLIRVAATSHALAQHEGSIGE